MSVVKIELHKANPIVAVAAVLFAKMRWQCVWGKTSIGYLPLGFLGATAIFASDEV